MLDISRRDIIKKKGIVWFSLLAIVLASTKSHTNDRLVDYKIEEQSEAFASYGKGLVYIGDKYYIDGIKDLIKREDIVVLDQRHDRDDPNMKVLSSYLIGNKKDKRNVLNILKMYEKMNPSDWDRSIDSMLVEWEVHNLLFDMGLELHRTTDVDFNNNDENKYDDKILKRVLR